MNKTAMQELIEVFNSKNDVFKLLKWIENNKDRLVEKEKEQIKLAFETGNILGLQSIERSGEWFYNEKIK